MFTGLLAPKRNQAHAPGRTPHLASTRRPSHAFQKDDRSAQPAGHEHPDHARLRGGVLKMYRPTVWTVGLDYGQAVVARQHAY